MRKATLLFLLVALVPISAFAQTYSLNIGVIGKGTTDPAPGLYTGYPAGAVVQIDAQPQVGHSLLAWLVNGVPSGTDDPLNLTITQNTVVQALFSSWFVTVAIDGSGFTAPVPGVYAVANGTNFNLQASPAGGWLFDHWDQDGVNIGSTNPVTRTITADTTVTAVFLESRTLTISASGQGTTDPAPGAYDYGDGATVEVNAIPDAGHEFVSWTIDGVTDASTDNPLSQLMDADHTVEAVFTDYIVTVNAATGGSTNPAAGDYAVQSGDLFSITATPDTGVLFVEWLVDGVSAGSANPLDVTVTADVTIEPVFATARTLVIAGIEGDGTTNPGIGSYTYEDGANVSITATPGAGQRIVAWIVNDEYIFGADPFTDPAPNPLDLTMNEDKTVFALFSVYSVTVTSGANGSLSVPDGTYTVPSEADFPIEATPASGFALSHWLVNGVNFGNDNPLNLVVSEDLTVESVFVPGSTLTLSSVGNGSTFPTSGSYVYATGSDAVITATPAANHALAYWLIDGVQQVPPDNPLTVLMDADHTVEAVFSTYLVNVQVIGDGSVDVPTGFNPVVAGESLSITPTANPGSTFVGWLIDGVPSGESVPLVYTPTADATVQAAFALDRTLNISVTGNGTTSPVPGASTYPLGTDVSITAIPDPNHIFLYWNVDGVPAGSNNPITVTMNADRTVEAVFTSYLLTIQVSGNGTTSPVPGLYPVAEQQQVEAIADSGWVFANWLVDGVDAGTSNPETFTLSADTTVTAVFLPERVLNLTVTGNGSTVPAAGSYSYTDGETVSIAATADPSHALFYWLVDGTQIGEGPGDPPPNPLELTMDSDKTVVAVFTDAFLTLAVEGNGSLNAPTGTYPVPTGLFVDLQATPDTGWVFDHWESNDVPVGTDPAYTFTVTGDVTVKAVFLQEFNLTTDVTPLSSGTVSPASGAFKDGTVVQLTATPEAGFAFVEWQGDVTGTDNPVTFTMDGDKSVTAVFEQVTFNLNVTVSPVGTGTVTPANGPYSSGEVLTLAATPEPTYRFVRWEGDLTGSDNPASVTMDADKNITAVFELQTYTFTASVSPASSGTVTPSSGTYTVGSVVPVEAVAAANYQFINWTGPVADPNDPTTTVTITDNTAIVANFQLITWTLNTSVSPVGGGSVDPSSGTYTNGTDVTLTATASAGYRFVQWTGDASGTNATVIVSMTANRNVTAVFIQQVTLTTSVTPLGSGSVDPTSGTYDLGATAELTATPANANYEFVRWDIAGGGTDTANPLSLTMDANKSVTAVFQLKTYELTTAVTPLGSGSVTPSSGAFNAGSNVQLTATPEDGFRFVEWQGDASGDTNPVSVLMDSNKSVTAVFAQITYELTTVVSPEGTGSVTPSGGTYVVGTQLSLFAEAADQYMFSHWTGDAAGSDNPLDVTMDGDKAITAVFVKEMFTLTTNVTPVGGGSVSPADGSFEPGEVVELTATPAANFVFQGWTGDITSSDNPVNVTMDSNKDVTAVFAPITYDLTTAVTPEAAGSVEPIGGTYNAGTVVALTATPAAGYEFVEWTGDVTGTDNPINVTMDSDKSVTAVFQIECLLSTVTIVSPVDGAIIVVDEGAQGEGIVLSAATDCAVDTESVTFQLDALDPVVVTDREPSGYYSVVSPAVDELGWGVHTLVATAASATQDGVTFTDAITFTLQPPVTDPDQNGNGLPDYPFAVLAGDGDSWSSTLTIPDTGDLRTSGAVRWDARCDDKQGLADPVVSLENPLDPTQVVTVTAPSGLLECGQAGILIVQIAPDLATLYGAANAAQFAADPSTLVDGGVRIEVSIIVSENSADFVEINPSVLALNPVHITVAGLSFMEGGTPLLYAHPTNATQDTSLGLVIDPLSGTWSGATVTNTVVGADSMDADLTGLSSLAVFQGPAIQISPSAKYRYVYGFTEVGTTKDAKFTVTNGGGAVMNGQATTAAPYSIVGAANYSLAPGQSAVITVRFTPTEVGGVTGAVVFTGGQGSTVQVVGTGYELTAPGCPSAGTIGSGTSIRGAEGDMLLVALVIMGLMVAGRVAARKRA